MCVQVTNRAAACIADKVWRLLIISDQGAGGLLTKPHMKTIWEEVIMAIVRDYKTQNDYGLAEEVGGR